MHFLVLLLAVFLLHTLKETRPGDDFFARLVTPDEFLHREIPPAPATPSVPSVPHAEPFPSGPSSAAPPSAPHKRSDISDKAERHSLLPPSQPLIPSPGEQRAGRPGTGGLRQPAPLPERSLREKLFDTGVIDHLAKKEKDQGETENKDRSFTLDTTEYKFLLYNKKLKERIESIWVYPPDAAAQGIYGDLVIRFTIKKNGRLGAIELVRTSGHKSLDDAAMKALKDGEPYWPLPDNWAMDAYTIQGHFVYTLYGFYVR